MKVNLHVSDDTFELYTLKFGLPGLYNKMKEAIEAYKNVDKADRVVLLAGDQRRAIEAVFQTTIDNPDKLVRLIQNMSRVSLGGIQMDFTADQLERMAAQAGFHGRTLETYMRETVDELKAAMLERS